MSDTLIDKLDGLQAVGLYESDFLLTWDKSEDEIRAIILIAEILRELRRKNVSTRFFESGIAVSQFRDNSTRTRFSFTSACNLLGLGVQELICTLMEPLILGIG